MPRSGLVHSPNAGRSTVGISPVRFDRGPINTFLTIVAYGRSRHGEGKDAA